MSLFDALESKGTRNCGLFFKNICYTCIRTQPVPRLREVFEMDRSSLLLRVIRSENKRGLWNHFLSCPKLINWKSRLRETMWLAHSTWIYCLSSSVLLLISPALLLLNLIKELNVNRYHLLIILSHRSKKGLRVVSGKHAFPSPTSGWSSQQQWICGTLRTRIFKPIQAQPRALQTTQHLKRPTSLSTASNMLQGNRQNSCAFVL